MQVISLMETLATIVERLLQMDEGILSVAFVNLEGQTAFVKKQVFH